MATRKAITPFTGIVIAEVLWSNVRPAESRIGSDEGGDDFLVAHVPRARPIAALLKKIEKGAYRH